MTGSLNWFKCCILKNYPFIIPKKKRNPTTFVWLVSRLVFIPGNFGALELVAALEIELERRSEPTSKDFIFTAELRILQKIKL